MVRKLANYVEAQALALSCKSLLRIGLKPRIPRGASQGLSSPLGRSGCRTTGGNTLGRAAGGLGGVQGSVDGGAGHPEGADQLVDGLPAGTQRADLAGLDWGEAGRPAGRCGARAAGRLLGRRRRVRG